MFHYSSNVAIHHHHSIMASKRLYCDLDKPYQTTWQPHPNKRPRRIVTPSSVISAVTSEAGSDAKVSPPPAFEQGPDSPKFDAVFNYQPPAAYPEETDAVSPVFNHYQEPELESPPSKLRSDEDIQADVCNSFAGGNCGTLSWSNELLIQVLANEVEDLIYSNDERVDDVDVGDYQTFYSSFKQPFELDFYMRRLVQYVNCSTAVFVTMFVYLDRVQEKCKALLASDMNCHRLVFTCLVLAVKYLEDEVHSNGYYARVGGLTIDEMNSLEFKLLNVLDWNLSVSPETYAVYEEGMIQTAGLLVGGNGVDGAVLEE